VLSTVGVESYGMRAHRRRAARLKHCCATIYAQDMFEYPIIGPGYDGERVPAWW